MHYWVKIRAGTLLGEDKGRHIIGRRGQVHYWEKRTGTLLGEEDRYIIGRRGQVHYWGKSNLVQTYCSVGSSSAC